MASDARPFVDVALERALLGLILADRPDADGRAPADLVLPLVSDADFGEIAHQLIVSAARRAHADGLPSAASVAAVLREREKLNSAGGESYVEDLPFYAHGAGADPLALVSRLHTLARARRLGDMATAAAATYREAAATPEAFIARVSGALGAAAGEDSSAAAARFESAGDGFAAVYDACDRREVPPTFATGFPTLDELLSGGENGGAGGGLAEGALVVVAARPGIGKTSFAANLAFRVARASNRPALMFSLEMTPGEIWGRLASSETGVPHERIRQRFVGEKGGPGTPCQEQLTRLVSAAEAARRVPMFIHVPPRGRPRPDGSEMAALARVFARRHGRPSVIAVDYVQLAVRRDAATPLHERIGEVTCTLKMLAQELGCAVIALSQLNRDAARADERPSSAQLRGSGALEQDADIVMLLHRVGPRADGAVDLIVDKNRNGPTGTVRLRFVEWLTRFEQAEQAAATRTYGPGNPEPSEEGAPDAG